MTLPAPTVGSTNVRGYILPNQGGIQALMSLYGFYSDREFNSLRFAFSEDTGLPDLCEVLFDVTETTIGSVTTVLATNIRRA